MNLCVRVFSHGGNAKVAIIFKCMAFKHKKIQKATHQQVLCMERTLRLVPNMTSNFTHFLNILEKKLLVI